MIGTALNFGAALERRIRHGAIDVAERTALSVLDSVLASRVLDESLDRILSAPAVERAVDRAVNSPGTQRMVASVIDSRLFDEAVARLLESRDLWLLVDEIAQSPAVTEAIGRQSVGFAEQVAGGVRERSRSADDRVERAARRLLRRDPVAP